eukprot:2362880-Heterocapsa_arctica.AAC.1
MRSRPSWTTKTRVKARRTKVRAKLIRQGILRRLPSSGIGDGDTSECRSQMTSPGAGATLPAAAAVQHRAASVEARLL